MPSGSNRPDDLRAAIWAAMPEDWQRSAEQRQAEDAERANRRNRGGRPKSANPKTGQVMVRLAPDERAILDERAGPGGIAEYLRALGLGRRPRIPRVVPEVNQAAWRDLAQALGNLNQLARHANEGRIEGDLAPVLEDLRTQVVSLRAALLGRDDEPGETP